MTNTFIGLQQKKAKTYIILQSLFGCGSLDVIWFEAFLGIFSSVILKTLYSELLESQGPQWYFRVMNPYVQYKKHFKEQKITIILFWMCESNYYNFWIFTWHIFCLIWPNDSLEWMWESNYYIFWIFSWRIVWYNLTQ